MKYIALALITLVTMSCVGSEIPIDGIYKNTPVVVNVNDAFTLTVKAEKYDIEETYTLNFSGDSQLELSTFLVVTDYKGDASDTSYINIYNSADSLITQYLLNSNMNNVKIDSVNSETIPKKVSFKAVKLTGLVTFVASVSS